METLKKFVKYYAPYKGVFFLDLLCAAIISFVDLAFPQILRSLTKNTVFKRCSCDLTGTASYRGRIAAYVCNTGVVQVLCDVSGAYDGSKDGAGYAPGIV